MEILRAENLKKTYGFGANSVEALKGVSFSIEKGEMVGIMGPSGSGKSTLLHILGGLDTPSSGCVYIDGINIHEKNSDELAIFRRRQVGIIYQNYNLIPVLSVKENILLPAQLDGKNISEERLDYLLEILDIKDKKNSMPYELSGGQQQVVSIARALINDPSIVLADEPTGNLDRENSHNIMELLKIANRKFSQSLMIITHDEDVALQTNRIITMDDGRVIRDEGFIKV